MIILRAPEPADSGAAPAASRPDWRPWPESEVRKLFYFLMISIAYYVLIGCFVAMRFVLCVFESASR